MNIYGKPVIFAIVAFAVILVGTLITTFIPLFVPATAPVLKGVTPYTPAELEGRDIYIREGCNNCHTQTVRPLLPEVARYGEPSKAGEFTYDRPFLWGSKRTGPDLARVGGKYPDSWHYQHMKDPQSMFPKSNMPAYAWLADRKVDTTYTERKMKTLGFPYKAEEIRVLEGKTEMDVLVAYLQKLGRDIKAIGKGAAPAEAAAPVKNPFEGKPDAIRDGKEIFGTNCAACHGKDAKGGIGPNLLKKDLKFGRADKDLFASISKGRPGGMPDWEKALGSEKIWKVIAYLRTVEEK
jgi:cytochrome c oxidase cbb3-type subunit 2